MSTFTRVRPQIDCQTDKSNSLMLFIYIRKRYKPEGKCTISFFFSKEYRKNGNNRRMKIEKRLNKEN